MSKKELVRRKIASTVFREAWKLLKRAKGFGWATVLKLSWRLVRSRERLHYSKVVGVAASGTPRQARLQSLVGYKPEDIILRMVRDHGNRFDSNAIRIIASVDGITSFTIGYLKSQHAAGIASLMDEGREVVAMFECITGRGSKGLHGLNFRYAII